MAKPRLILRDLRHPSLAEGSYELNRSPIRIGRGPRCEIRLHSDRIADVQVILRQESNRWTLHPVGPAEGCEFRNGYLTEITGLEPGTPFRIGHVELTLAPAFRKPEKRTDDDLSEGIDRSDLEASSKLPEDLREIDKALVDGVVNEEMPMVPLMSVSSPQSINSDLISAIDPSMPHAPTADSKLARKLTLRHDESMANSVNHEPAPIDPLSFAPADMSIRSSRRVEPLRVPANSTSFAAFTEMIAPESARQISQAIYRSLGSQNVAEFPKSSATTIASEAFGNFIATPPIKSDRKDVKHHVHEEVLTAFEDLSGSKPRRFKRFVRDHSSSALFDGVDLQDTPKSSSISQELERNLVESIQLAPVLSVIEVQPDQAIEPDSIPIDYRKVTESDSVIEFSEASNISEVESPNSSSGETALIEFSEVRLYSHLLDQVDRNTATSHRTEEFEAWLDSVGSNLESVETAKVSEESRAVLNEKSESDLELESSETGEPLIEEDTSQESSPSPTSIIDELPDERQETTGSTSFGPEQRFLMLDSLDSKLDKANEQKTQGVRRKLEVNEWPSAQDILRWSADRHGRSILFSTNADHSATNRHGTTTGPQEFMRLNFPTALLLCFVWLAGAGVLVVVGMKMSVQDELTQRSMSALFAAEQSGGSPRLDRDSQNRLGVIPSWWEATDDQLWWRSAFMRMREEKGQSGPRSSAELAAVTTSRSPLLPAARLWRASQKDGEKDEADYEGLSRDIIPLILTADHHRRLGETAAANQADRIALKLTSSDDPSNVVEETVFDAEFGMGRFLIPGQKKILAILKRLVAEPNASEIFSEVLPDDRPLVWLTAAQLMRHAGIGDANALAEKAMAWQTPSGYSGKQQRLMFAIRAEALAFSGKTGQAIEAYERLTRSVPESEWKRSLYYNLGELHIRNQKTDAAMLALRKARGVDPNHEVDRHAIAAIRGLSGVMVEKPRTTTSLRTN